MNIEQLTAIKKQCKLTDMELARFNQMYLNQSRYPSGRTAQEMKLPLPKIANLIVCGHLKKAGFCVNGRNVKQALFVIA